MLRTRVLCRQEKGQFLKLFSDPQRTTLSLATRKVGKQLLFCLHSRKSYRSLHYLHQQVSYLSFPKGPSIRLPHHGISLLDLHCAGQKGCREPKVSVQGVLIVYHSLSNICTPSLSHHPRTPIAMLAQSRKVTPARPTSPLSQTRQSAIPSFRQSTHPPPPSRNILPSNHKPALRIHNHIIHPPKPLRHNARPERLPRLLRRDLEPLHRHHDLCQHAHGVAVFCRRRR